MLWCLHVQAKDQQVGCNGHSSRLKTNRVLGAVMG